MSTPRPNELSGQVDPNTLSAMGGRPPTAGSGTPIPTTSNRGPASNVTPAPGQPPTATHEAARPVRRPFSLWTVVVLAFIGINVARGFLPGGATPSPRATVPAVVGPVSTAGAAAAGPTIDPNVTAGVVDFGTGVGSNCEVTGAGTSFAAGTKVWWYAHLGTDLPGSAQVVVKVEHDSAVLDRETGPGDPSDQNWNGLCAGDPLTYFGAGLYRLDVWDSSERILLSSGEYTLAPEASP